MFNPSLMLSQLTIGEVIQWFRDLAILGVIAKAVWHSRGVWEWGKTFLARVEQHMTLMEEGMQELRGNHLKHIEADLAKLAGRKQEEKNGA